MALLIRPCWNDVVCKARSPVSGGAVSGQQWVSQIDRGCLGEQARKNRRAEGRQAGTFPSKRAAATATKAFPGKEPEHFVAQVRLRQQNRAAHGDTILIEPKRNFARTVAISKELIGVKRVVAQILIERPCRSRVPDFITMLTFAPMDRPNSEPVLVATLNS